ncbi:MAG: NAD(P)/FAD-dependent oxidoreductase [Pseudolabrys sp.]
MAEQYDVAIVGARCAGASLATFLAREGARVALFDKDPLPSEYVMSTHTLHPCGMDVLDQLNVGDRVRAVTPGLRVVRFSVDDVTVDATYREGRLEHCPRRHRLDALLQDAAVAAGVRLFDRTRLLDVLSENGRVVGIKVKEGQNEREVGARLVVGADGRHSTVADRVGAFEYLEYDAPRACYWAYWPAPRCWQDKERYPFDMYLGRRDAAFRFIFPTDDDELLLGTSPPLETVKAWKHDLKAFYRADLACDPSIRGLIEDNEPVGQIRGTVSERYFFRKAAGAGWALVGDAGHHKDFIIGDGITEALLQSRALASAIAEGRDAALVNWWRQRDADALPLFRFAEDQGLTMPAPMLVKRLFARLARARGGGTQLLDGLDRRASPYDAIPLKIVLAAAFDGLLARELGVVREFLAQGRRGASVRKEILARAQLAKFYELSSWPAI